jgi:hypothetical protein
MPAGAHWTLRYEPTINDRIQSRVDAERLRHDEFVLSVEVVRSEYREPIFLEVQFGEDRDGPYDPSITREIGDNRQVSPTAPPEPERPGRSLREIIEELVATPLGRIRIGRTMAAPIRSRLDYVSQARHTLLAPEIPNEPAYSDVPRPLDQGRVGDALAHLAAIGNQGAHEQRWYGPVGQQGSVGYQGLTGVQGAIGYQGTPGWQGNQGPRLRKEDIPEWLKPGVWAKNKLGNDIYVEVESIDSDLVLWEPTIRLKFWRVCTPPQNIGLRSFLQSFTQCEKPADPTSRYERIIKGV